MENLDKTELFFRVAVVLLLIFNIFVVFKYFNSENKNIDVINSQNLDLVIPQNLSDKKENLNLCSNLNSKSEEINCINGEKFSKDNVIMENYLKLSYNEKKEFDCSLFSNPSMISTCRENKLYLDLDLELKNGNMDICGVIFSEEKYGIRAKEYENECLISYVVSYSKEKDCSILSSNLKENCTKSLKLISDGIVFNQLKLDSAIDEGKLEICENNLVCIDSFYLYKAENGNNFETCSKIFSKGIRVRCQSGIYLSYAILTKNISYCDNIEQDGSKELCKTQYLSGVYS